VRFSAFISYSSTDGKHARWLHRVLEAYTLPAVTRLDHPALRENGRRLKPVFRDRDELSAAHDLAASIRQALSQCEALVVICSPAAAGSRWVDAEVQEFQRLGRKERIFCLLAEPQADGSITGCFPPSLMGADGSEPLAADLRIDGRTGAKLKLIAGILGLDYDQLRQREQSRRNRQLAIVASAALAGLVVTSGLAIAAYLARNEAIRQRDTAEQTVAFVKSMFEVSDPSEARGSTITAREILDGARVRYSTALRNEPVVQSEIALTLSEVYGSLGLFAQSDEIAGSLPAAGLADPQVASRRQVVLGESLFRRGEFDGAVRAYRMALRAFDESGQDNPALLSRAYSGLGQALTALDAFDQASAALDTALKLDTGRGDTGQRDVARDLEAIGLNHMYSGNYAPAEQAFTQANRIRLALEGVNSPSVSDNIGNLASIAYFEGRSAEAEKLFRSRLEIDERVLGKDHPDVGISLGNLARLLVERRAFGEAGPLLKRAIAVTRGQRGDSYVDLAFMLGNMAIVERAEGQSGNAETLLKEAIAIGQQQNHRSLAPNMVELASLACDRGQFARADALLASAAPLMSADYPDDPWRTGWLELVRAECLAKAGKREAARKIGSSSVQKVTERWPEGTYYRQRADRLRDALGLRVGSGNTQT
jgi:tetratricopeptide (TPR) repeat protein